MTSTDTRKPFTTTTWATLAADHAYLSRTYARAHRLSWEHTYDLACELADRHRHLTLPQVRVLVDLCKSGTPVILTWQTQLGHDCGDALETTTAAVVVEYVGTSQIYVHYCGFGHWVQLSDVTDAHVFETVRTYVHP